MRNDKFPEPRHVPDPINLTLISEFYYDNSEPKSDSKNRKLTFNNLKNNEFVSNDFTGF